MIDLIASLHRLTKDHDSEVTVTFKVPKSHAAHALSIPEETALCVTIAWEEASHEREGSDD